MFFTASHSVILLFFAVAVVFAGIRVFELRNTSATYNARLFTFGYLSLTSWILWVLQYAILAARFFSFASALSLDTVFWLGLMQNILWASAVLSLHLKQFYQKSLSLPFLVIFSVVSVVTALVAHQTRILTSAQFAQFIAPIDGISTATIFIVLGISIVQLRLSKISAAVFLTHGFSQWIWTWRWLTSFGTNPIVQFAFPFWRIALLIAWFGLISEMVQRAQPSEQKFARLSDQKAARGSERPERPNLGVPLNVMISSTVEDLVSEREAVDLAIRELQLTRFRAETFGSVSHPPKVVCAFLAEQCDIFVLIIGERYGYIMSEGVSVVEFEYETARGENPQKILVYVKEAVDREPRLREFLRRVEDFDEGYFRSLFKTHDDLRPKVQGDIARWLASRVSQNK